MAVPEASVDEDHCIIFRQDKIGFAAQFLCVKPVPEPACMQRLADGHFRACVSPSDRRHVAAAGCCVVNVSQRDGAAAF